MKNLKDKIKQLWNIVNELENDYPNRKFTVDGHLLGSIGEVYAAEKYGLTLLNQSEKGHDAKNYKGELVQIKVTQIDKVGLRKKPDNLIVLKINEKADFVEIYNGKGNEPWIQSNKPNSGGQRYITLKKLEKMKINVP